MSLWRIKVIIQRRASIGTRKPISSIPKLSHKTSVRRLIQKKGEKIFSN
jgi:hypothetical protein